MNPAAGSPYLLAALLLLTLGWTRNQSTPKPAVEPAIIEPQQQRPALQPKETRDGPAVEPESLEGSGKTVWAKGFEGELIAGLDGDLYEPYRRTTIEFTQRALRDRGLYAGPINGILDMPTMKAIYEFQKASRSLQLCGIPTPLTRSLLMQGSHTDPVPPTQ